MILRNSAELLHGGSKAFRVALRAYLGHVVACLILFIKK